MNMTMKYNTEEKKLSLPEYGRNIHNMVDYCVSIKDKEERKRCADSIISIMGNMFPHLRDVNDFKHILWDHLAIMSDFKLDIDYPYEVIKKENLYTKPPRIRYSNSRIRYKHYGKTVELMINKAKNMPQGEERDRLTWMIAVQMKKSFITWNKDNVDDRKIFADLAELSSGEIRLDEQTCHLPENKDLMGKTQANNNNKKNTSNNNNNRKSR
jgi:hypothetical protein